MRRDKVTEEAYDKDHRAFCQHPTKENIESMLGYLNKLRLKGYCAAFLVEDGFFDVLVAFDKADFIAKVEHWRSSRPDGATIDVGTGELKTKPTL